MASCVLRYSLLDILILPARLLMTSIRFDSLGVDIDSQQVCQLDASNLPICESGQSELLHRGLHFGSWHLLPRIRRLRRLATYSSSALSSHPIQLVDIRTCPKFTALWHHCFGATICRQADSR